MIPYLFPEIYECILEQLPVQSGVLDDESARTLAYCAHTCRALRSIAILSHIWRPHYLARWSRSKSPGSMLLSIACNGNYRLMYVERRLRDERALESLDHIIKHRKDIHSLSVELVEELNYDVWDILKAQKVYPLPASFSSSHYPSEDWFARNHWAEEITSSMTRRFAVEKAIALEHGEDMNLEEGLWILSGFWGIPFDEVSTQFDALASSCRVHLESQDYTLDPSERSYDRVGISLEVCAWMRTQGFEPAIGTYQGMREHFIHKVLSSHRKSLPLSLVVVFVAICRRLGIPASPVGPPGHVHAFVPLEEGLSSRSVWASYYDAVEQGIHIDVYNFPAQPLIDVVPFLRRGERDQLKPSSTHDMLFRAGRDILTSAQLHQLDLHTYELDSSVYAVFCIFLIPNQVGMVPARGFIQQIMAIVGQHYPMDLSPILQRLIAPVLGRSARNLLEKYCARIVEDEESYPLVADRGPVRYFVGLVFVHRIFDYLAVVLEGDDHCHASNDWIIRFGIDSLERGRNQAFYTVLAEDGSSRYVAEDNIIPIVKLYEITDPEFSAHVGRSGDDMLRSLVLGCPGLGRHFLRPREAPRGRVCFIPHADMLARYPGDDQKIRKYIQYGIV